MQQLKGLQRLGASDKTRGAVVKCKPFRKK